MTTVLQLSLYGLIVLASIMLAYAEGTGLPDAVTVPLAVLALFLTERWNLFRLRTRWANCLGLAAFGLGAWELSRGDIEARLLSLAHVLVYLTWIVLFLEKSPRMYWTMCTLALLHVAVGAVLTSSGVFGALLAVFLVAEVWTLTVFTLHRAKQKYSESTLTASGAASASVGRAMTADGMVWNRRSRPISTVQIDPHLRWISGPFVFGVAVTVVLSAGLGGLFFVFTPRIWVGSFTAFGDEPDTALRTLRTGFAEEVQLGDIGQILESTHPVFEVRLVDHDTGQPIGVEDYAARMGLDEPVFRGAVLGEYANGKWRSGTVGQRNDVFSVPGRPPNSDVMRQEFRLEPTESGVLFAMPPHNACRLENKNAQVFERRLTSVLYRDDTVSSRDALNYVVFSEKPSAGSLGDMPRGTRGGGSYRHARESYRDLPTQGLERLQALARRIAESGNNADPSPLDIARRLETYLKSSGEFGYTLDMSIDDPTIDAVEDFLFNRKQGHCEYFASALALMLRAVDIPARLVSGFKGGDLNPSTGYFIVQQRHSHVWVEALLDRQWLILDPTPASRSDSVKSLAPKGNLFSDIARFFSDAWSHQVVGLSLAEQNSSLYTPLKEWATQVSDTVVDEFNNLLTGDLTAKKREQQTSSPLQGVSLPVLFVIALFWLLVSIWQRASTGGLAWLSGRLRKLLNWILPQESSVGDGRDWRSRLSRWWALLLSRLRGESTSHRRRVEFYERLLRVLRSVGLEPLPAQTSLEFVIDTQPRWRKRLHSAELAGVPQVIVAQFYRVRFGGESLSTEELRQLDDQLSQLETECRRV
ncbi:MAG TPA: DUF3488 and transglutaminase-like domain-containing protein, partial [Planctomycetaceae bacterium]|nr:DUF3488 and transglutaminase-like domain-containing protein [Planctomycetaceae bacterium]